MCRDRVLAQPVGEMPREPLGHPSRVDENKRRPMRFDQLLEPVVVLLPHFLRHHCVKGGLRNLDPEIDLAPMPGIDDRAVAATRSDEVLGNLLDRLLGR